MNDNIYYVGICLSCRQIDSLLKLGRLMQTTQCVQEGIHMCSPIRIKEWVDRRSYKTRSSPAASLAARLKGNDVRPVVK